MNNIKIKDLYDVEKTIAKDLFSEEVYPWELLSRIKEYIIELGKTLSLEEYDHPNEDVWISKTAKVYPSAYIGGPCIIDHEAEIRHCAFIRGSAIIGKKCVVGNSTELKNVILFDEVEVQHFNYVGDSVLGYKAHMGAGAITANIKLDKSAVKIKNNEEIIETDLIKVGSFLADNVQVGCNSVIYPGTIICKDVIIYPLSKVNGVVSSQTIYK